MVTLQLRDMFRQAGVPSVAEATGRQRGQVILEFDYRRGESAASKARILINFEIETAAPHLLVCLDLGTSATACWFGSTKLDEDFGEALPLGDLLHKIVGEHEEYEPAAESPNVLIPSHIGLSSALNLRSRFDPLSLGNLACVGASQSEVAARLATLSRRYDLSIPFVPRQDMASNFGSIVRDPKRKLISTEGRAKVESVFERMPDGSIQRTNEVDVPTLIEDFFDEFGRYLAPRALLQASTRIPTIGDLDSSHEKLRTSWLERNDPIGLVVTHPAGLTFSREEAYRRGARRFMERFAPGRAYGQAPWIKLVPEAIAAARYGVQEEAKHLTPGRHLFAAIDIGAGTYDATLIEVEINQDKTLSGWTILTHFALTIGGRDLDQAIEAKVCALLDEIADDPRFDDLDVRSSMWRAEAGIHDSPLQQKHAQSLRQYLACTDAIQSAKRALSRAFSDQRSYDWGETHAKTALPNFRVIIGREPDNDLYPVRRRQTGARVERELRRKVDDIGPTWLSLSPKQSAGGDLEMALEVGPGHFMQSGRGGSDRKDPWTVVQFLGQALPRMLIREAQRLGRLRGPEEEMHWVVTGRTALWPPLFEAITKTVRGAGYQMKIRKKPYPPDVMKQAVLFGAISLASEPELSLGAELSNPLAVVRVDTVLQPAVVSLTSDRGQTRRSLRIRSIEYLPGSERPSGEATIACSGRRDLVRALPGLAAESIEDALAEPDWIPFIQSFGIAPFEVLIHDIGSEHGRGQTSQRVRWRRIGGQIHVALNDAEMSKEGKDVTRIFQN